MKPTALLGVPIALTLVGCFKPPEVTASSRAEAMANCRAGLRKALSREWLFLQSDESEIVRINRSYCSPKQINGSYWRAVALVDYTKTARPGCIGCEYEGSIRETVEMATVPRSVWKE